MQSSMIRIPSPTRSGRNRTAASRANESGSSETRYGSISSTSAPVGSIAVRSRSSPYAGTGVTRWNGFA